jgi:hypothetical protein
MNPDFVVGMAAGALLQMVAVLAFYMLLEWASRPEGE